MSNEIEAYAKRRRRLHPEVVEAMAPLFEEYGWSPSRAKVRIVSPFWGKLSGRGSPTAVFVLARTIYIMRGALNAEERVRSNSWDLASVEGFCTLAHEVFHTYQNDRDGFGKFVGSLVFGVWRSLRESRKLFDHKFFDFEREAIEFEAKARTRIDTAGLRRFADMR